MTVTLGEWKINAEPPSRRGGDYRVWADALPGVAVELLSVLLGRQPDRELERLVVWVGRDVYDIIMIIGGNYERVGSL